MTPPFCPERCHAREGPHNAAERCWWCKLCGTTPVPASHSVCIRCHGLPRRISRPCHQLVNLRIRGPLTTAFSPLSLPRGGGSERGAARASKQVTDAIINPQNERREWTRRLSCCTLAGPLQFSLPVAGCQGRWAFCWLSRPCFIQKIYSLVVMVYSVLAETTHA